MATISGSVIFDRDRSLSISSQDSGIAGIPVVLQNTVSGMRLVVLTDTNGNYSFINVADGSYRIVEAYGETGGVTSPGDFANAVVGNIPEGVNPPVSAVSNPPTGTTNIDSLTPDTLFVTVAGNELTNQNFYNGPVIYTPIEAIIDECAIISGDNLINVADEGTFGTFPAGTSANTGAPTEPYPDVTPDFTYVLPNPAVFTPLDGEYTVQNIMNNSMSAEIGAWWRIADHTIGNETGRMMIVNGFNPGAVFFRDTIQVKPNTNYLFRSWILNLFRVNGYPNPELGVQILDENGGVLYSATLGALIPVNTNAPEWKEIGTVINSRNNTSLTVEFLSEGPEVVGNDYAIDDIAFNEILIREFIPVKTASTSTAFIGEEFQYTITLEDPCGNPLTNVFFQDMIPAGLSFVEGSVIVNGISQPQANPNTGFIVPDVPVQGSVTITFTVRADSIPAINPTLNHANMRYSYTPVEGGIPQEFEVETNEVPVTIAGELADISITKSASPSPLQPGKPLTYTIIVRNAGPSISENVVLTDTIPADLLNPEYSIDGGTNFLPWTGSLNLGNLNNQETRTIFIRADVSETINSSIINTAQVTSQTPDPNLDNNTTTITTPLFTARCQAWTDIIESIALQESALANILQGEGSKMQEVIQMENTTTQQLFQLNCRVTGLVGAISRLENILQMKLQSATNHLQDCEIL
ncbi:MULTISPECIES: SdrD B-like domain-containing protein [Bacillota]|uniref:DUF11 domain-containing protein n=2 Tax=Amedibacillus TaxID=2749846 RepID=A0A7G9GKK2_9FIRM|nr:MULTISPECIES: SdrD B-like domain-containing protein [Erysipelotrichaceae]QNM11334.1 DUF11 domain-containing protein [[Eubacterium] hominis]MCH4284659.1 DUF11 domain-containing protein [Amedibacillus hominis]RGB54817.1 DUF11 domain-containing protein [Absiella sp. AM22-9]RGB60311.1 DUF11 domain-containing protein [Absiella sp. AM10-20]RGB68179.1 DUF11 domain-containing protein [Absiella sp. AM09-45]